MDDFKSNVPNLPAFERRAPRSDWKPDEIDLPQQSPTAAPNDTKQPIDQKAIQNMLNPSGDMADNPYDFGAILGEM